MISCQAVRQPQTLPSDCSEHFRCGSQQLMCVSQSFYGQQGAKGVPRLSCRPVKRQATNSLGVLFVKVAIIAHVPLHCRPPTPTVVNGDIAFDSKRRAFQTRLSPHSWYTVAATLGLTGNEGGGGLELPFKPGQLPFKPGQSIPRSHLNVNS